MKRIEHESQRNMDGTLTCSLHIQKKGWGLFSFCDGLAKIPHQAVSVYQCDSISMFSMYIIRRGIAFKDYDVFIILCEFGVH